MEVNAPIAAVIYNFYSSTGNTANFAGAGEVSSVFNYFSNQSFQLTLYDAN